ncbi:hypothetical protein RDI58_017346 [Solanum bulbocastanum]|uniref:Uncharacterized protein n=1 Tax=Solanum bulbocastanum TaxID=147425 RepID=A0AAN8TFB8_SOLBU
MPLLSSKEALLMVLIIYLHGVMKKINKNAANGRVLNVTEELVM